MIYLGLLVLACLGAAVFILWWDLRKHPYDPNNDMPEG